MKDESKLDEVKSEVPLPTQTLNKTKKGKTGKRNGKQQGKIKGKKSKEERKYAEITQ